MDSNQYNKIIYDFSLIGPKCGIRNPKNTEKCAVCDKYLKYIIGFIEDDSFDLEISKDHLIEYRKNFWGWGQIKLEK